MAEKFGPLQSATFLLKSISNKQLEPSQLTPHQRRLCVRYLLHDMKHTCVEISEILKVHPVTVRKDKQKILKQDTWVLDDLCEIKNVAASAVGVAERAITNLFKQNKNKDAWVVKRELIEMLQSLGYIERKPMELNANLTLLEMLKLAADPKDEKLLGPAGRELAPNTNGST